VITIETTSVSAVRAASRVEGRLYFNKLHKTASGKYRGCAPWAGGVLAKQAYLRYACTASGTVITIPDIVVEPTTDALIGNDVRATFALFDADTGKLLMIIAEEVRLPASPSTTSWAALKGAVLTVPAVPAAPVATAIASDDVSVVITGVSWRGYVQASAEDRIGLLRRPGERAFGGYLPRRDDGPPYELHLQGAGPRPRR
jgi:hypothetical protein